jgi:hypothetical protein
VATNWVFIAEASARLQLDLLAHDRAAGGDDVAQPHRVGDAGGEHRLELAEQAGPAAFGADPQGLLDAEDPAERAVRHADPLLLVDQQDAVPERLDQAEQAATLDPQGALGRALGGDVQAEVGHDAGIRLGDEAAHGELELPPGPGRRPQPHVGAAGWVGAPARGDERADRGRLVLGVHQVEQARPRRVGPVVAQQIRERLRHRAPAAGRVDHHDQGAGVAGDGPVQRWRWRGLLGHRAARHAQGPAGRVGEGVEGGAGLPVRLGVDEVHPQQLAPLRWADGARRGEVEATGVRGLGCRPVRDGEGDAADAGEPAQLLGQRVDVQHRGGPFGTVHQLAGSGCHELGRGGPIGVSAHDPPHSPYALFLPSVTSCTLKFRRSVANAVPSTARGRRRLD